MQAADCFFGAIIREVVSSIYCEQPRQCWHAEQRLATKLESGVPHAAYRLGNLTRFFGGNTHECGRCGKQEWPYFANNATESNFGPADPHECINNGSHKQICMAAVDKDANTLQDQKIRDSCISHLHLAKQESNRQSSRYFNKPFFVGS